ncbi:MAG: rhamnosyltransferase [Acinetobacter ursingii]|uniref:rhamnosyltransferase n=1 Tax=Acinetobacter johnsonii TaxID=40214 RepID=UPI001F238DA3|nr:rhamnosyltransferase [Acinetobacter johnsonii]UIP94975.1 rhamnosyltransferase [Acinetobacter johnsonii]
MKKTTNVGVVVISFNPEIENLKNLVNQLLIYKNILVYVVDNASSFNVDVGIQDERLKLIKLKENTGIAKAQNVGIDYAEKNNAEYIVFFDQDSTIPDNFINDLMFDYKQLEIQGLKIGAIGPRFMDERFSFFYPSINYNNGKRERIDTENINKPTKSTLLISSGSLVSTSTLLNVGLMRENYFIDYVDTEWCFRAESKGYSNYISSRAVMKHAVGDNMIENRYFKTPIHSPFRRYYITRNAFYMLKEPHIPKGVAIRQIFVNFIQQIIIIINEKNKKGYIMSFYSGVKDGLKYLVG